MEEPQSNLKKKDKLSIFISPLKQSQLRFSSIEINNLLPTPIHSVS